jgi:hypothetical protein
MITKTPVSLTFVLSQSRSRSIAIRVARALRDDPFAASWRTASNGAVRGPRHDRPRRGVAPAALMMSRSSAFLSWIAQPRRVVTVEEVNVEGR